MHCLIPALFFLPPAALVGADIDFERKGNKTNFSTSQSRDGAGGAALEVSALIKN